MEAFAINWKILLAQVINFSIILFVLGKYAYKPILGVLEERKDKIAKGLSDADKAAKSLEQAETEAKEIRDKAFREAKEIIEETRKSAGVQATAIVKKANDQADRIMKDAKEEAESAKKKALTSAKHQIGELIAVALSKILKGELSGDQKDQLAAKSLSQIEEI